MAEDEKLTESITFRVSETDLARLQRVAGPVSKSLVARAAMLMGIEAFEAEPAKVLQLKPAPRGPRPKKKRPAK